MNKHLINRVKEEYYKSIAQIIVNQYTQTINVDCPTGNFILLTNTEVLRIVEIMKELQWSDGKDRPFVSCNNYTPNKAKFDTDFNISQTIKYFPEDHCFNVDLKRLVKNVRIGRTKAVARELFNPKNYEKSHVIDIGTKHCGKESLFSSSILENSVDEAIKRIRLDTVGNVGIDDLIIVLGKEANDKLKLPNLYRGVKVICDNALDDSLRFYNEISPDSAVICARFDSANNALEPNFSTCVIFAIETISFEPNQNSIVPGELSLTITEKFCARVVAPTSGCLLTNLFKA